MTSGDLDSAGMPAGSGMEVSIPQPQRSENKNSVFPLIPAVIFIVIADPLLRNYSAQTGSPCLFAQGFTDLFQLPGFFEYASDVRRFSGMRACWNRKKQNKKNRSGIRSGSHSRFRAALKIPGGSQAGSFSGFSAVVSSSLF